ncbi:RNA-binding cell elongation regulator Jag/EloR [Scatolibacter rhodanostii]|uniref:RNA-binding cell elongation regulator Jag/EloR n=1 Tax=Scatolibacter rhodanostii TaxID=2014781 RepID=UPI000C071680|nr:RNA-binding cell elongation regulator Jag/EloR [Scatolibacter rhodanostii]
MLKEAIATGETVEIALDRACAELGIDRSEDEFEFEILETPVKKTFGLFGGSPAKVKVFLKQLDAAESAAEYLKSVLKEMGLVNVGIEIRKNESGAELVLNDQDVGFIIGHRGETLDALQYLASLVANHSGDGYYRITLDVGQYREKRKETLESLGKKMAQKALKTGRNHSLEPMNPYERRIIHTAVQDIEGAKSWSEGEDLLRHVVIGSVNGERFPRRDNHRRGNYQNRGGKPPYNNNRSGNNNNRRPYAQNQNHNSRPVQSRGPKQDVVDAPLYSKIEK